MKVEGQIVDIIHRKIFPGRIEIRNGIIYGIESLNTAPHKYILPGFIDAHVHIESSMVLPSRFAEVAVSHGTIATVSDPHEIANVMGMEGVDYMIEDGSKVPFRFFFGAPSCVPATPFDHGGAVLAPREVEKLLSRNDIYFLSEMMNFPGVIQGQEDVVRKLMLAREKCKPVDGHAPGLSGNGLKKYLEAGITTDHECFTLEEAREKIEGGMIIQIREGSAARNFNALHPLIRQFPGKVMFCTDDCHPNDLLKGHIDTIVKKALKKGYDLFDVLRAASLLPREHYNLNTGLLQKGDYADFIVVDDLNEMDVKESWIKGEIVYKNNNFPWERPDAKPINNFSAREILQNDIEIISEPGIRRLNVIQALDGELITKLLSVKITVKSMRIESFPEEDILKIVVVNRYCERKPAVGFVKGFGLKTGAIAGSIAHDSHNLIAVGVHDIDIITALNSLMRTGGGIVATHNGQVRNLPLPVAGLMSTEPVKSVAAKYDALEKTAHNMGCQLKTPFMTLAFMSLLVIPELKIGDDGLFDVTKFAYTSLFTE